MSTPPITVQDMRSTLLPLAQVREALAATEPLSTHGFSVGERVRFHLEPTWYVRADTLAGTAPVEATLTVGNTELRLTKDALLEATSICGLPKTYVLRAPGDLIEPQLNFWFQEGLAQRAIRNYQVLTVAGGLGAAITRASVAPFSNLRLLEASLTAIEARFGHSEILVDHKFTHTLRRTHLRLIIPAQLRTIHRSGTPNDEWSIGTQIVNSLVGEERTSLRGYMFRWVCRNGATDTAHDSGVWSRRGTTRDEEIYDWARTTVDEILGGLEGSLDAVQSMVDIPIEGEANTVLTDVFEHYRVPLPERARIIENMIEADQLTMYAVMNAITQVANDPDLEPAHVENLLRMGGDLPHAATSRCTACSRLLPH